MAEISVDEKDGFVVHGNKACFPPYTIKRIIPDGEWETGAYTSLDGTRSWYKNGEIHRDGDEAAVILPNGSRYWYMNGKLHRSDDKPAIVKADGSQYWYKYGSLK